jgi:hypothetical protein
MGKRHIPFGKYDTGIGSPLMFSINCIHKPQPYGIHTELRFVQLNVKPHISPETPQIFVRCGSLNSSVEE